MNLQFQDLLLAQGHSSTWHPSTLFIPATGHKGLTLLAFDVHCSQQFIPGLRYISFLPVAISESLQVIGLLRGQLLTPDILKKVARGSANQSIMMNSSGVGINYYWMKKCLMWKLNVMLETKMMKGFAGKLSLKTKSRHAFSGANKTWVGIIVPFIGKKKYNPFSGVIFFAIKMTSCLFPSRLRLPLKIQTSTLDSKSSLNANISIRYPWFPCTHASEKKKKQIQTQTRRLNRKPSLAKGKSRKKK